MSGGVDESRRRFLHVGLCASGALLVGFGHARAQSLPLAPELIGDDLTQLSPFVLIERDNRVVIGARGCETGQGVITSLPMLIAEELDVDWSRVRVTQLPYGYIENNGQPGNRYGNQSSDGHRTIPLAWKELREAGAATRALLVAAAARVWSLPAAELQTASGHVVAADGRRLRYGTLARTAASLPAPVTPRALKDPDAFHIIGKPTRTTDAHNIVTGRTRYGSDEYLSGMLFAVILRCPTLGGALESCDESAARKVVGVRDIVRIEGNSADAALDGPLAAGIAVIADNTWAAIEGRRALVPAWTPGPWPEESTALLSARAHALLDAGTDGISVHSEGDMPGSRRRARLKLNARYEVPFLAHAPMETPGALIEIRQDSALLIASLQDPDGASRIISEMTGLPRTVLEIRLPRSGGSFGRRLRNDFVAEAVLVAKASAKPVKLLWLREDDIAHDFYRPFGVHALAATLDRNNRVAGWSHRCAATPRNNRNAAIADDPIWKGCMQPDDFPTGLVAHLEKTFFALESGMPRDGWQAPMPAFDAFAVQCFIDEIAFATRRDPVQLRLEMLGEPRELANAPDASTAFDTARMAQVLRVCAEKIRWSSRRTDGHGLGIACHYTSGGYVAHAFEIAMQGEKLKIHRAVCVVDVGRVINPLGLEAQLIGGTIDGISSALNLAITVKDGRVQQRNFPDYRLLPMAQAPAAVEVHAIESSRDPVDADELGIASVAPALANAIFATTTVRIRKLPLMPELLRML